MDYFGRHFEKGGRHTLRSAVSGAGRLKLQLKKIGEGNSCSGLLTLLAKDRHLFPFYSFIVKME